MDRFPFREGFAAAPHPELNLVERYARIAERQANSVLGCAELYKYPTASSKVDATQPVDFQWDTSCKVGTDKIDLYIYNPSASNALVKAFTGITFSDGHYSANLSPKWWNYTTKASLYTFIIKSGDQPFLSQWSQGPTFEVDYTAPMTSASGSSASDSVFQSVADNSHKGISKGIIAVAVVIPVVVIAILGFLAFYFYRVKEKEKLNRWSQALSQHSSMEWEKGALPGERVHSGYGRPSSQMNRNSHYSRTSERLGRPSTAYSGIGRPSMSSVGRPSSSVMMDNMAGAGAYGPRVFPGSPDGNTTRSSIVMPDGQVRQSRVSFADTQRPRMSSDQHLRPPQSSLGKSARDSELIASAAAAAAYASGSALDDTEEMVLEPAGQHQATNKHESVYDPDQMLAVYAARSNAAASTPAAPAPAKQGKPSIRRFLSRRTRKDEPSVIVTAPPTTQVAPPDPTDMRSYVHLNNGTASRAVVDSLPAPGPTRRPDSDGSDDPSLHGPPQTHSP